jgi:opacity protein-like surface antigen
VIQTTISKAFSGLLRAAPAGACLRQHREIPTFLCPRSTTAKRWACGACTHWKAPPCHGAHPTRTLVDGSTLRFRFSVYTGLEYAFTNNWSAKVEYLYVDLGSFNTLIPSSPGGAPDATTVHHKYTDNIARVGLNYKWGGPVVARY